MKDLYKKIEEKEFRDAIDKAFELLKRNDIDFKVSLWFPLWIYKMFDKEYWINYYNSYDAVYIVENMTIKYIVNEKGELDEYKGIKKII